MLSLANVSAAQAENYYERDDYYTQGDPNLQSDTRWQGKGSTNLNLTGPVDKQIFQQLLHGETPDGRLLHSKAIQKDNHRAATDYTFSAPKSVSIAALIQKDSRVIAAHDQAVETAISVLEERYSQTRVRRGPGIREKVQTGNVIAATFRHETSREQDPQLHTHCVIINATQLANGKWQSLSNEEVLNNQKLLGEIYQNELAVQLRQHGYEIEPNGSGQFECKGYDESLLNLFSTRTQQIEQYIERWETAVKEAKGKPLNARQKKQVTLATRLRKKSIPRAVLLEGWHRAISSGEVQLPATPIAQANEVAISAEQSNNLGAIAAVAGVGHASERESVFRRERAERFALEHHLGQQSFAALQTAMVDAGLIAAKNRHTTQAAIERELDTIAVMESGQGQADAISNYEQVERLLSQELSLTAGQYDAIQKTALSTDQFLAWQGVAGAGKTYSLKLVAQLAREQGYEVTGYAPSAQAANVLTEEANIESNTVARLLHSKGDHDEKAGQKKALWIVDEAGLLSAKNAHELLTKAQAENARVILVGDLRQLSAVEAGNPFKSLQIAGIETCYLEESRRQKTDALRAAVVCLAAGEQREGLEQLDRAGMVHEVSELDSRRRQIVIDYISQPSEVREQTLVLCGTNVERLALTAELRAALQTEGTLGDDRFKLRSLRSLDRTKAQLKYAAAYSEGEVVVPVRDYRRYGLEKNGQYTVTGRDVENNLVTVKGPQGEAITFDPSCCADKMTYAVQEIAIAQGDQLRWTRNDRERGLRNGQLVKVKGIDTNGTATLRDADGQETTLKLTGQQYLDYALVSTTYSSQGKTAERVLVVADGTLSKEGLYVAVSRAKTNLSLYTADRAELYQKAERSAAKENPSDYLTLFNLVNPDAENEKTARTARALRGADQSEYLGARAGECVAHSHRAAVRRDRAAPTGSERATSRAASLPPEYVADVRSVVAGIAERLSIEGLRRQAERIGEAAQGIIDGAGQLELTAAAVARLDGQLERKAKGLSSETESIAEQRPSVQADGVVEVVLKKIDPDDLARYQAQIAKAKTAKQPVEQKQAAEQDDKRRRRREIYQQYAAKFAGKSLYECDRLVVRQLMSELLAERSGQRLSDDEMRKVGSILLQGPVAQELKETQGKEAGVKYAVEVLAKERQIVEKARQTKQIKNRDRGMEM